MSEPITVAEWREEGTRLFGEDMFQWQFRCPVCGNVAKVIDYKAVGGQPDNAAKECIGRFMPNPRRDMATKPKGQTGPCDYASFGLFRLGRAVVLEDGETIYAFPFAELPKEEPK